MWNTGREIVCFGLCQRFHGIKEQRDGSFVAFNVIVSGEPKSVTEFLLNGAQPCFGRFVDTTLINAQVGSYASGTVCERTPSTVQ